MASSSHIHTTSNDFYANGTTTASPCEATKEDCPICFEILSTPLPKSTTSPKGSSKTVLQITKCGHIFHRRCLRTWTKQAPTCPMCRAVLFEQNASRYEPIERHEQAESSLPVTGFEVRWYYQWIEPSTSEWASCSDAEFQQWLQDEESEEYIIAVQGSLRKVQERVPTYWW